MWKKFSFCVYSHKMFLHGRRGVAEEYTLPMLSLDENSCKVKIEMFCNDRIVVKKKKQNKREASENKV